MPWVVELPIGVLRNTVVADAFHPVNGPGLFSVSTRPAALTAATSDVRSLESTALSTMSLVGRIASAARRSHCAGSSPSVG